MGKKRQRSKQISNGERQSTNRNLLKAVKRFRDLENPGRRLTDQYAAYKAGKRVKESFLIEQRLPAIHKSNTGFKASN